MQRSNSALAIARHRFQFAGAPPPAADLVLASDDGEPAHHAGALAQQMLAYSGAKSTPARVLDLW